MSDSDDVIVEPEEDGAEEKADAKLKKLRDELKEAKKERDEYLAGWQRSKADYLNLSRRIREEDEAQTRHAAARVARSVIAILDSIEAAKLGTISNEEMKTLGPIEQQLCEALRELGVVPLTPKKGEVFDPNRHEPIQTVATENENEDNTISETLQSGYTMHGFTIRPARVAVNHYQPKR